MHIVPDTGDMTLVAAAKNGKRQAFEVLVGRHEQKILAVARRNTRTREDAEDVVQQSFQKAFLHLHQFEGRSSLSTWLTRIAINEAQMLQRKSGGGREGAIDDLNENGETANQLANPDPAPHPETDFSQQEGKQIGSYAIDAFLSRRRCAR